MKKLIGARVVAAVLSIAILLPTVIWIGLYNSSATADYDAAYGPANEIVRPLVYEYDRMFNLREIEKVKYNTTLRHGSSMCLLIFQICKKILYTNVYLRCLKKYHATGIFTVTTEDCVGMEESITKEQYDTLISAGWSMAIGLPEKIPKDGSFDAEAYFSRMEALLAEQGISRFPTVFVFGRENYSKSIYESVLKRGFKTIAFNRQDPNCDIVVTRMTDNNSVLHIPYCYTSKRTPIRSVFEKSMRAGDNLSISTGGAQTGMRGETATRDTTEGSLKDIVETIKYRNSYYRSLSAYRKEKIEADTTYLEKLNQIAAVISDYDKRIRQLHLKILNAYAGI